MLIMTTVLRFFLAIIFVGFVTGQYLFNRICPTQYGVKQNFDVKSYIGLWYEIERYDQPFEENADCVTSSYGEQNATPITVENRAKFLMNGTGTIASGVGALASTEMGSQLGRLIFGPAPEDIYQILDTDYTHFSFVYNCVNLPDNKSSQAYWLLSRTPQLTTDDELVAKIDCLKRKYIVASQVRTTEQGEKLCSKEVEYVDLSKFFTE